MLQSSYQLLVMKENGVSSSTCSLFYFIEITHKKNVFNTGFNKQQLRSLDECTAVQELR